MTAAPPLLEEEEDEDEEDEDDLVASTSRCRLVGRRTFSMRRATSTPER